MVRWHEAGTYCEEFYGSALNTAEGWFICPECGEILYEEDYEDHYWDECPICGFEFFYGEG